MGESFLQQTVVCDAILLKAVEEGCWCVLHFWFLDDHNTLKVGVHTGWFYVGPNGNIGVVASTLLGIINPTKALVEEVIEAFVDVICLGHDHCVAYGGPVTNSSNCVNLGRKRDNYVLIIIRSNTKSLISYICSRCVCI